MIALKSKDNNEIKKEIMEVAAVEVLPLWVSICEPKCPR
jgi:hypothetical protein